MWWTPVTWAFDPQQLQLHMQEASDLGQTLTAFSTMHRADLKYSRRDVVIDRRSRSL